MLHAMHNISERLTGKLSKPVVSMVYIQVLRSLLLLCLKKKNRDEGIHL